MYFILTKPVSCSKHIRRLPLLRSPPFYERFRPFTPLHSQGAQVMSSGCLSPIMVALLTAYESSCSSSYHRYTDTPHRAHCGLISCSILGLVRRKAAPIPSQLPVITDPISLADCATYGGVAMFMLLHSGKGVSV